MRKTKKKEKLIDGKQFCDVKSIVSFFPVRSDS